MKRTIMYALSFIMISGLIGMGSIGCGNSSTNTIPPLNPDGVYQIVYSPATVSANCVFTDTTSCGSFPTSTCAGSPTVTTFSLGNDTITITGSTYNCSQISSNGGFCTSDITWLQGNQQYHLTGLCSTDHCHFTVYYPYQGDCSDATTSLCTAGMTISEDVTTSATQITGTATLYSLSVSGTLVNGDNFVTSCDDVTNPVTLSGTKQ